LLVKEKPRLRGYLKSCTLLQFHVYLQHRRVYNFRQRGNIMRIGIGEILVVLVLFILLFGAKKLPDLAQSLGKAFKSFRKEVKDIKKDMDIGDSDL
jgi:sec-independent protein translocase protein TatA